LLRHPNARAALDTNGAFQFVPAEYSRRTVHQNEVRHRRVRVQQTGDFERNLAVRVSDDRSFIPPRHREVHAAASTDI
jgi:hypothetical protein